jgi:hypothetical protein
LWTQLTLFIQGDGDLYGPEAMPDVDDATDAILSTSSISGTQLTSTPVTSDISKVKSEASSKTPSRSGTPKMKNLKRSIQDAFAESSAKDNEFFERMGTQRHACRIGEMELKYRKLETKAMEKQHQREREHEQHEFRMMQMQIMMAQNPQRLPSLMQSSLEDLGLMAELNDTALPSGSSSSLAPYSN